MERTAPTDGWRAAWSARSDAITPPIARARSMSPSSSYTRIVASAAAQETGWLP